MIFSWVNILSRFQLLSFNGVGIGMFQSSEGRSLLSQSMNQKMENIVSRTAPTRPGLENKLVQPFSALYDQCNLKGDLHLILLFFDSCRKMSNLSLLSKLCCFAVCCCVPVPNWISWRIEPYCKLQFLEPTDIKIYWSKDPKSL